MHLMGYYIYIYIVEEVISLIGCSLILCLRLLQWNRKKLSLLPSLPNFLLQGMLSLSLSLFLFVSFFLSLFLFLCLSLSLSFFLSLSLSLCLFVSLSLSLSVSPSFSFSLSFLISVPSPTVYHFLHAMESKNKEPSFSLFPSSSPSHSYSK